MERQVVTEADKFRLSRRRFIAITGIAAGCALWPLTSRTSPPVHRWRGTALGAAASIHLVHPDPVVARELVESAVDEISRLERIFSLYRGDSDISRLNRAGALTSPPLALIELLTRAIAVSRATEGAFDVTIQPLWQRYAHYFARNTAAWAPPIDDVLPLVDWRAVEITPARLGFRRHGMAVTLNGIAQGFITDRVADLFRRKSVAHVLLDLGEIRAVGRHYTGRPWRVAIADPASSAGTVGRVDLADRALATSGGYGTLFDAAGRFTHLIDPRNGRTASAARSITVTAADATTADAYSTAFALMDETEIAAVARDVSGLDVYLADAAGVRRLPV
jgi:FAD:protein FMN transferase